MRSSLAKLPPAPASGKPRPVQLERVPSHHNTSLRDGFVFVNNPVSVAAHRYRKMCAEIVSGHSPRKQMLVTSPSPGDGKTMTAVNMAFALTERGSSVLLLELAMERPRFRYVFGEPPTGVGVESVLRGTAQPAEIIGELGDSGIAIAGVKAISEKNFLLNGNPYLTALLEYAEKHYDWTIVDAPEATCVAVAELARTIETVVLVVRSRQTQLKSLRSAVKALNDRINFVIMNDQQR